MYLEIDLLNQIDDLKTKKLLILEFIQEYSGWLQHVKSIGMSWGANGEESGALIEEKRCLNHIEKLKKILINL